MTHLRPKTEFVDDMQLQNTAELTMRICEQNVLIITSSPGKNLLLAIFPLVPTIAASHWMLEKVAWCPVP